MTLGIVKRTEEEFQQWLMTESGFVAALIGSVLYSLCAMVIDVAMERIFPS